MEDKRMCLAFRSWDGSVAKEFPIQTNGGLNIIPAVHVTMPASPLIISALDSSKERRVMD